MKLRTKIFSGFMALTLVSVIIGGVGVVSSVTLNGISDELFELQAEQDSVSSVLNAHYAWRQSLTEAVLYGKEFNGSLDPNSCALGKWYQSEHARNITDPELLSMMDKIRGPHTSIHEGARVIAQMIEEGDSSGAQAYLQDIILPRTDEVISILASMQMRYINLVAVQSAESDRLATVTHAINIILIVVAVAVSLILALLIARSISKPISALTNYMKRAGSTGDLTLRPAETAVIEKLARHKNSDEVAELSNGAAAFVKRMLEVSSMLESIAGGDLAIDIKLLSDADTMGSSLKQMVDSFNRMITEIQVSAEKVSSGSSQISHGAHTLAQGATEQAATVDELSQSIARINQMAKENSESATAALDSVRKAGLEMGVCTDQMSQMMTAMKTIDEKSKDILKTTKLIDDIAFQTNILALNAAVEAARAGQHGKGFAVVAEEVRNLASKSAEAAKQTAILLESSTVSVEEGNLIVEKVSESLRSVVENEQKNAENIASVQSVSLEQSSAMSQVTVGISQVSQVISQNSATAEESAAASIEMSEQAEVLQQYISRFKVKDNYELDDESQPSEDRNLHELREMYVEAPLRKIG